MSETDQSIPVGLIGAGIFMRDAHIPALTAPDSALAIRAIYSRTEENARMAADLIPDRVDVVTDLAALLGRDDIDAVIIALPIPQLPEAVRQALDAGKHIVSEKPVAPTVATGRALVQEYRAHSPHLIWMVGENWRYETAYTRARELVTQGAIGRVRLGRSTVVAPVTPASKYYATEWRRSGAFPGGFVLDGGVHHVAALRTLLGEVESVSASVEQLRDDLPPADTVSATLRFAGGALVVYQATYALDLSGNDELLLIGEQGTLRIARGGLELINADGSNEIACPSHDGVQHELAAFAAALRHGTPHRNTPEEALRDVAVVEAMLESAQCGCAVAPQTVP